MDDTHSYSLPLRPDISSDWRACPSSINSNPSNSNEQYYSARGPSSPDAEDMHGCWIRYPNSSARQRKKNQKSSAGSDKTHQESKKQPIGPRNQNPGIDVALRAFYHEIDPLVNLLQKTLNSFRDDTEKLRKWAEQDTLNTVWRNKIDYTCRNKTHKQLLEGAPGRFAAVKAYIKQALKQAKLLKETWDDRHDMERQVWVAKRMLQWCGQIIDLAQRVANEFPVCKELIWELQDVRDNMEITVIP
ncbi:hypothetical protein VTJ49DRAFT_5022 [Mycothermus thermophilus]|uniref:Uncharacterized protein n=1 Tax=Humicola insolens TaxID=85995 RepID=A0ABR3VM43_HUMIN